MSEHTTQLTLLHISDLHFGPYYVPRVGDALLAFAYSMEPDIIIASGDFTQRAKPTEFADAADFMETLPDVPKVVVPGNHDVPLYRLAERLFEPHKNYRAYLAPELNWTLRSDRAVIVALDSTAPRRAITNGRISRLQLEYCARELQSAPPGAARIVVAHHHFAPAPDYEGGEVMPKAKRAMDMFTSLRVDLVMGGHLHRAYIGNSLDVYPGLDREHGIIIAQSGTSASRRGRAREAEKNTANVIRIGEDLVRVTHYMYFDDVVGFAPISRHIFPRATRPYFETGVIAADLAVREVARP
ncbi:MAG TPA: metallophosphoesterase [Longimicrobiales bacterium]|nr:metallophosphoesterase [Longimicrobiales bacterium]